MADLPEFPVDMVLRGTLRTSCRRVFIVLSYYGTTDDNIKSRVLAILLTNAGHDHLNLLQSLVLCDIRQFPFQYLRTQCKHSKAYLKGEHTITGITHTLSPGGQNDSHYVIVGIHPWLYPPLRLFIGSWSGCLKVAAFQGQ